MHEERTNVFEKACNIIIEWLKFGENLGEPSTRM